MRAMRLAVLTLATLFVGNYSAQADDRGTTSRGGGFDSRRDFRRDDFRRDGDFRRDDFRRRDGFRFDRRRFCRCGFDFYRFPGHHHHHDNRRF
jgi:hypothetical protein